MAARLARLGLVGGALLMAGTAQALDYRSLAAPAILYDAPPPAKSTPVFVIKRMTPVEVVIATDKYAKVRDPSGGLAWVERKALSEKRTLIVTAAKADVHQKPDTASPLAFEAVKDVVLELADQPSAGWVKVRHRDGSHGYLRTSQVWGR